MQNELKCIKPCIKKKKIDWIRQSGKIDFLNALAEVRKTHIDNLIETASKILKVEKYTL
jgi:hypothetical protein